TATTGCYAAGRGRSSRPSCGPASATGTTRYGARSSPASGWRGTPRFRPDVPSPPLARSGRIDLVVDAGTAARASGAVVLATPAEARADERRRVGRRVLRRGGPAALAQPGAAVGRCVVRLGGARAAQPLRSRRGPVGDRRHADPGQRA